jgi:hypothetical protein
LPSDAITLFFASPNGAPGGRARPFSKTLRTARSSPRNPRSASDLSSCAGGVRHRVS